MTTVNPAVVSAARAAQAKWGIPASISIAQYGLESGWGKHMPPNSLNPFGIKALPGQQSSMTLTREVVHGQSIVIHAAFRVFASLAEAFDEHARLLAQGRPYAHARTLLPDVEAFAHALTGVYATDPKYGDLLISIIRGDGLTQFDKAAA